MSLFTEITSLEHEQIMLCYDRSTNLKAIIAIHNTVLGPALGGTRFWNYASEEAALTDVLRLSRGMTYKAAAAGLNLGGGKAVIIGDPKQIKSEALLRRFGKFVENLNGKYITAEDVGVNEKDMEYIHYETSHVTGIPISIGGSGDPSPFTAYGVYIGMKATAKKLYGSEDLSKKKIVVQGVGKVGYYLISHLRKEGATVYAYDIQEDALKKAVNEFKVIPIDANKIFETDAEIYAPCALGATINPESLAKMKFEMIAGGANNQLLEEERDGNSLMQKGILYAPDFVINAGGLMNVYTELEGYSKERAIEKVETIYTNLEKVYQMAETQKMNTQKAAIQLAENRIHAIANIKKFM
ncbi:MAG: Glu/Leu/Phe/Val dehydrogenase [Candidatus Pacearchaeota archaeon]